MDNYYEILQVSSKASKEIIEKAFKTLAKKYHPDANALEKKEWAEERFKKINAAYEILSNQEKRQKYDEEINRNIQYAEHEKIKKLYEQNEALRKELDYLKARQMENVYSANKLSEIAYTRNNNVLDDYNNKLQREIDRRIEQAVNKAYRDAYMRRMKDYGYTFYRRKTFKQKLKDILVMILAISFLLAVIVLLWQLPDFRNYVEGNEFYKILINISK